MLRSLRNISFIFVVTAMSAACSDDSEKMFEPLDVNQVDDDPASADENAGSLEDSADEGPAPNEPMMQEDSNSFEMEGAEDGALSEPSAPAMPEAAPSEKGGIISSGVKDKKRCRLIADELERQKCLRSQAK